MRTRPTALVATLAGVLFAIPACKKGHDGPVIGLDLDSGDRRAMGRAQNNLKQIALAMHAHLDSHGFFPAGIAGPEGKSVGLSWRVQILPYIEQVTLYRQFKLDEPWDSPNNKALISQMPSQYAPPEGKMEPGTTYIRSFTGDQAFIPPLAPDSTVVAGQPIRGRSIGGIPDGTSNTLMVIEAADPVIWTKPDELVYDPKGPVPKFGGVFRGGANVAFCDGSVRFLRLETSEATVRALITPNGGDIVGSDY